MCVCMYIYIYIYIYMYMYVYSCSSWLLGRSGNTILSFQPNASPIAYRKSSIISRPGRTVSICGSHEQKQRVCGIRCNFEFQFVCGLEGG